jgi:parvulin-like peptidyl-prolyl isomerase
MLAGCGQGGGEQKVVATAGSEIQITLADFNQAYSQISPPNRPDISTLELKRNFANDLVNKEILLAEAHRIGGITDTATLDTLEQLKRNKMLELLYREEVESKVEVLGRDVAELYEHRKFNVSASHILFENLEAASDVRAQIEEGKISFEDAARQYSLDQGTKQNGGKLPPLVWGQAVPQFQMVAFDLEPGALSEPVETQFGVHLIRVDARVEQELDSLETMRPTLRTEARRQLEIVRMREFVDELAARENLAWNDAGLDVLHGLIAEAVAKAGEAEASVKYLPTPTPDQEPMELATYSGRSWTIGDYVRVLAEVPPTNRPATTMPRSGLKEVILNTQIQNELLVVEARARGLDQRPDVLGADLRVREQLLIERVHGGFLQAADVPIEDVRAVFDSSRAVDPAAFTMPERVDMLILTHEDPQTVEAALARIRGGEPEEKVIVEISMDMRTNTKGGRTGLLPRGNYSEPIEDVAFSGWVGKGWSEPIVTQTGTGAIKVLQHEASRLATFEEVKDGLMQGLARNRGEEAFEEWLNNRRQELNVRVNDDVLNLVGQTTIS